MDHRCIGTCIVVLDKQQNKILIGKRKNSYGEGRYGLPGGRVEPKEALTECAKRELLEETNLQGKEFKKIGSVREVQEKGNFVHFVFECSSYVGILQSLEPEKCEQWEWFDINKLPTNILRGHKEAISVFLHPRKESIRDLL